MKNFLESLKNTSSYKSTNIGQKHCQSIKHEIYYNYSENANLILAIFCGNFLNNRVLDFWLTLTAFLEFTTTFLQFSTKIICNIISINQQRKWRCNPMTFRIFFKKIISLIFPNYIWICANIFICVTKRRYKNDHLQLGATRHTGTITLQKCYQTFCVLFSLPWLSS